MKYFALFALMFLSCKSYKNIDNSVYKLNYNEDFIELQFENNVGASSGLNTSYPQHYKIDLPLNFKSIKYIDNVIVVDYKLNQTIIIYNSFRETKNKNDWMSNEINSDYLSSLNGKVGFTLKDLEFYSNIKKNRITKIYNDDKTKILLLNIKPKNIIDFSNSIKSFKYKNGSVPN